MKEAHVDVQLKSNKLTRLPHVSHTREALLRGHIENFERFAVMTAQPQQHRRTMPLPLGVVPLQSPVEWAPHPPNDTVFSSSRKGNAKQPLPLGQPASAPSGGGSLAARIVGEINISEASAQLNAMVRLLISQELQKTDAQRLIAQHLSEARNREAATASVTIPIAQCLVSSSATTDITTAHEPLTSSSKLTSSKPKPPSRTLGDNMGSRVVVSKASKSSELSPVKSGPAAKSRHAAPMRPHRVVDTPETEHSSASTDVLSPPMSNLSQAHTAPHEHKKDVVISNLARVFEQHPPAGLGGPATGPSSRGLPTVYKGQAPPVAETVGSLIVRAQSPQHGSTHLSNHKGSNKHQPKSPGNVYRTPLSCDDEFDAGFEGNLSSAVSPTVISIPSVQSLKSPTSTSPEHVAAKKASTMQLGVDASHERGAKLATPRPPSPIRNTSAYLLPDRSSSPLRRSPQPSCGSPGPHHAHPDLTITIDATAATASGPIEALASFFAHSPRYAPSPALNSHSPKGSPRASPLPRMSPQASPIMSRHGSTSDFSSKKQQDTNASLLAGPVATKIDPAGRPAPPRSPSHYHISAPKDTGGGTVGGMWSMKDDSFTTARDDSFDHHDELGMLVGVPSVTVEEASVRGYDPSVLMAAAATGNHRSRLPATVDGQPPLNDGSSREGNKPTHSSPINLTSPPTPYIGSQSQAPRLVSVPSSPLLSPAAATAKAFSMDPLTLSAQIERDRLKETYEPELSALREKQAQLATAIQELERAIAQADALEDESVAHQTCLEQLEEENGGIVNLMRGVYDCITFCKEQSAGSAAYALSDDDDDEVASDANSSGSIKRTKSAIVPSVREGGGGGGKQAGARTRVQSTVVSSNKGAVGGKGGPSAPPAASGASLNIGTSLRVTAGHGGGGVSPGGRNLNVTTMSPRQKFLNARTPSPSSPSLGSRAVGSPAAALPPQPGGRSAPGAVILRGGRTVLAPERKRKEEDAEMLRMLAEARQEHETVGERLAQDIAVLVDRGRELLLGDIKDRRGKGGKKAAAANMQSALQNALVTALADNSSSSGSMLTAEASMSRMMGSYSDDEFISAAILEDIGLEIADFQSHRDMLRLSLRTVEGELQILLAQLHTMAAGSEEDKYELAKQLLTIVDDENIVKPDVPDSPASSPAAAGQALDPTDERHSSLFEVEDYDIADRAGFRELRNSATQVNEEDIRKAIAGLTVSHGFAADLSEDDAMDDIYRHERLLSQLIHHMMVAVANITAFHENLEVESTCKQCLKLFQDPRTLWPCGHTFCGACLPLLTDPDGNIVCSECLSPAEMGHIAHPMLELLTNYQRMNLLNTAGFGSPSSGATKEKPLFTTLEQLANDLAQAKDGFGSDAAPNKSPATPSRGRSPSAFSPALRSPQNADLPSSPAAAALPSASTSPGAPAIPSARRGTLQFVPILT